MSSTLYNKVTYTVPLKYIIRSTITEYDIAKANINILLSKGMITKKQYTYYDNFPKKQREILIGLLQRDDKRYVEAIKSGIIEAKEHFFKANQLEDHHIVSIKNDAVFVMNKQISQTKFGLITFKQKHSYSAFYKLGTVELYYTGNQSNILDIKNISLDKVLLHKPYMIAILKSLFNTLETDGVLAAINMLLNIYDSYRNLEFDLGFYREFNPESRFLLKAIPNIERVYKADFLDLRNIKYVDTSYNEWILRELYKILIEIYDQTSRYPCRM